MNFFFIELKLNHKIKWNWINPRVAVLRDEDANELTIDDKADEDGEQERGRTVYFYHRCEFYITVEFAQLEKRNFKTKTTDKEGTI